MTKDFVKFLALVFVLYLGQSQSKFLLTMISGLTKQASTQPLDFLPEEHSPSVR